MREIIKEILTENLDKLEKYVYDPSTTYLDSDEVLDLMIDYSNEKKVLAYRGLFFDDKEKYEDFLNKIENNSLITKGISSWTPSKATATQFARTKPTNNLIFLGREFFKKEGERKNKKEYTQGYGVILQTVIDKGKALDVTLTDLAQESELILPATEIIVKINKIFKPHSEKSKEIKDINHWIQQQRGTRNEEEKNIDFSLFEYIIHNYDNEINHKSRKHLFNMFSANLNNMYWELNIDDSYRSDKLYKDNKYKSYGYDNMSNEEKYLTGKDEKRVIIGLRNFNFNLLTYYNMFLKKDQKIIQNKLIVKIKELTNKVVDFNKNNNNEYDIYYSSYVIRNISTIIENKKILSNLTQQMNINVGKIYNQLNSKQTIDDINKLSGSEQRDAIYKMAQDMKKLFQKMV